ncbi:MAG: hypothetical protein ACREFL_11035 [Stellaceae bacterium]
MNNPSCRAGLSQEDAAPPTPRMAGMWKAAKKRCSGARGDYPIMVRYALCDRRLNIGAPLRGVSCDEDGVFLAGEVPLVMRSLDRRGKVLYQRRSTPEINFLFLRAYGPSTDFSDRIASLSSVARYMNEDKWVLAKIATVHLRLPDLPDDVARARTFSKLTDTWLCSIVSIANAAVQEKRMALRTSAMFPTNRVFLKDNQAAASGRRKAAGVHRFLSPG